MATISNEGHAIQRRCQCKNNPIIAIAGGRVIGRTKRPQRGPAVTKYLQTTGVYRKMGSTPSCDRESQATVEGNEGTHTTATITGC